MKKMQILLIILTIISCKEYKALRSESTNYNDDLKLPFNSNENEFIDVDINGIKHNLFFDTGAGVTLISNAMFTIENEKIIRQRKIYGFDKKTSSTAITYTADYMSTNLFRTINKYMFISKSENILNCSKVRYDGILGNFFSQINAEKDIILNYEKGFIEIVEKNNDKIGYHPLEAKFSLFSGKFYVKLEINGVKDFFLFDTGNKTGILLNKKVFKTLPDKIVTISTINYAVNNTILKSSFNIYQMKMTISDDLIIDQSVAIDLESKRSVLNQQFIKKFNWIIDRKANRVYCKPINRANLQSVYKIPTKNQLTTVNNNNLFVSFSIENISKFNVGDQINSVNNQKVTSENICEMQELLNKTQDWDSLNLAVISSQ
jgi:hypothetical protein